jgi:hypothetical protein
MYIHGKNTVIKFATKDVSQYTNASELDRTADVHDTTGYGLNDHTNQGGLLAGTGSAEGTYDNTAVTGPRAALMPLLGTTVALVRQPEGAGAGKPQDACSVVMSGYNESAPVADMVKWKVTFTVTGAVNTNPQ